MKILFVCTGNSCRSPMAEAYFAHLCQRGQRPEIKVGSAGIYAYDGGNASPSALSVMKELGIDMTSFRSSALTREIVADADLIMVMTAGHRQQIVAMDEQFARKIRLLLEFDGGGDVPDPIGGSHHHYRQCFDLMRPALDKLFSQIDQLACKSAVTDQIKENI